MDHEHGISVTLGGVGRAVGVAVSSGFQVQGAGRSYGSLMLGCIGLIH